MTARCSTCHCFVRNCPPGLPNHRGSPVGPQCLFNSQGRHYRDPADPQNPLCDYESNGVSCDFYLNNEFANIPYPADVTLGPVSEPNPPQDQPNQGLAQILELLNRQKETSEVQAQQMKILQDQVNGILQQRNPAAPIPVSSTPQPIPSQGSAPIVTLPSVTTSVTASAAPRMVTTAAANLSAALQSGLGTQHNYGYSSLTMDQLRQDPRLVEQAATILGEATRNVPPLSQMGVAASLPETYRQPVR